MKPSFLTKGASTPSPMPSGTSTPRTAPASQAPELNTESIEIRSHVYHTQDWLKSRPTEQKTINECTHYASIQHKTEPFIREYMKYLQSNPKIRYDPEKKLYSYKPELDITTVDELLSALQSQTTAQGISVRALKDGWKDVEEEAINPLEADHKLLVIRNKKDNHARHIWLDDPTLNAPMDQEFQTLWHRIKLPEHETLLKTLKAEGMTLTGNSAIPVVKNQKVEKKQKKVRRGGKTTNTHMVGVLRDYSHLKP